MKIRVQGIGISVAHFIEVDGFFESLHGHNLLLSAQAEGRARTGLLMDFRELEKLLVEASSIIDHRLIVPERNPKLKLSRQGDAVEIRTPSKRYRVPENDVAMLPIANSTVEEVGRFIYDEVKRRLPPGVKLSYVSVQESEGKEAIFRGRA